MPFLKRCFALLLVLTLCCTAGGCLVKNEWEDWDYDADSAVKPPEDDSQEQEDEPASGITPLLYKITDTTGNTLWLFGAIHVGKQEMYPLPQYVMDAFQSADTLAVEVDILAFNKDLEARKEAIRQLRYADDTLATDVIPKDIYDQAVALMKREGNYDDGIIHYMPSLWTNYVDTACYRKARIETSLGVDRHLLNLAYEQNKAIYSIESGKFQYGVLASFSQELQLYLLEEAVKKYTTNATTQEIADMIQLWQTGDEEALTQLLTGGIAGNDAASRKLQQEYLDIMFTQRNENMTQYAQSAMRTGKEVFICVGVGHLVGPDGIAQQLKDLGCTVQRITQ